MTKKTQKQNRGRPPVHKPEENKRLMTRTTEAEYELWTAAAEKAARDLGIPNLTIGPWSRMVLNQAAKALGFDIGTVSIEGTVAHDVD